MMRSEISLVAMGALMFTGDCVTAPSPPRIPGEVATTGGAPHDDARFLAQRQGENFRVDVHYVDMLNQSVIVVRQGQGEADESWQRIDVPGAEGAEAGLPYAADPWRGVAIEIARKVAAERTICRDGRPMEIDTNDKGEARAMYRAENTAWVVFAACPAKARG